MWPWGRPSAPPWRAEPPGFRPAGLLSPEANAASRGEQRRRAQGLSHRVPVGAVQQQLAWLLSGNYGNYVITPGVAWAQRQVTYLSAKHTTALT